MKLRTYIDIEPNTGVVISARRRAQLSVSFNLTNYLPKELQRLKTTIYPIFWYDFPYEASSEIKTQMSTELVFSHDLLRIAPYFLIALAMVFVVIALVLNLQVRKILKRKISKQNEKNETNHGSQPNHSNHRNIDSTDPEAEELETLTQPGRRRNSKEGHHGTRAKPRGKR